MRRFLSPISLNLTNSARSLAEEWNAFWFQPADPTLLGVIRILTGLMLLYTHAVWGLVLGQFFGPASWLSADLVRAIQQDQYTYSFWWLVPDAWMWHAYGLSMAVLLLFTVGLWTRLTSILSFVVVVSFAHRVPEAMFGLDQINGMLSLYLAIGPSGQALSLDRVIAGWRRGSAASRPAPSAGANLALRLINVHMCVIYFFAGISKLQGESWWTGEAMWRALSNLEYQSIDMTWLAASPLAPQPLDPRLGALGDLLLRLDLAPAPPPADAGHGRLAARGHWRLPWHVDLRPDHARRLRLVPASGRRCEASWRLWSRFDLGRGCPSRRSLPSPSRPSHGPTESQLVTTASRRSWPTARATNNDSERHVAEANSPFIWTRIPAAGPRLP